MSAHKIGLLLAAGLILPALCAADMDILPTPHYVEALGADVRFPGHEIRVHVSGPELEVAETLLARAFPDARFAIGGMDAGIFLHDYSASHEVGVALNFLDRQLLEESPLRKQSYVLRTDGHAIWVVGGGSAGVLYGAATAAQLLRENGGRIEAPGTYIRDYPDFPYRAAADWLLNTEINRWSLDRGQGLADYGRLVRKELDRAALFKINVAVIDGFGWSLDKRPPGYAALMRELNRYARRRGMLLQYGGYGAAYDIAQRPGEYQGTVFLNREAYPDGKVYQCLAFPERQGGIDPRTMGSCRSNEELNRLKAEDLARFVEAVEPGLLYIHHEDCCVFEDFQKAWLGRCERCRRRWPNDSLIAPDGGAGALAHGYGNLINAVNRVRHDGYDAARDTQITIVSPVYMPATARSEDWGQVLALWRSITRLLPRAENVQICFREILPQQGGGRRWVELFNSMMRAGHLPFGAYVFVVGGAENFLTDYATTGIPAMNAYYRGARTIYNATGDAYRGPMEVLAAEYSWNARSTGFYRDPANAAEMSGVERWIYTPASPAEIYGPGKLFDRICAHLYGPGAGPRMSEYYRLAAHIPDVPVPPPPPDRPYYAGRKTRYLPRIWEYATALPDYWYHLLLDSQTWGAEPEPGYEASLKAFNVTAGELHRRLARRWQLACQLNRRGAERVQAAIAAHPKPDTVEDLRFLEELFRVYQPLLEALRDYHTARWRTASPRTAGLLAAARKGALAAEQQAMIAFPEPVDPAIGDIRSLRTYPRRLADAIEKWGDSIQNHAGSPPPTPGVRKE